MKFFVVALSLVAICSAVSHDDNRKSSKFFRDCTNEHEVTTEDIENYNRNDVENFVDEPKAQNFFKCIFVKIGFIDQSGDLLENVAIEYLTIGDIVIKTEEQMKQCTKTAGDNKANPFPVKLMACYRTAARV